MSEILIKNVTLKGQQVDIQISGNKILAINPHPKDEGVSGSITQLMSGIANFFSGMSSGDHGSGNLPNIAKSGMSRSAREGATVQKMKVIDGTGKWVIPGLINMHTHSGMSLTRGFEEDKPLVAWLNRVWEVEQGLNEEMIYWGTRLACLEMIKSGTTCFNDQYWMIDQAANAVEEAGIRAFHSYVFLDGGDAEKAKRQRKEAEIFFERSQKWDPRNHFTIAIHAPYTVCEENMTWVRDFTKENNLLIHTHLSETQNEVNESLRLYGKTPIRRMYDLGILSDRVLSAHSLWLNDEDIALLGETGVTTVHNVNSNLKLASGFRFRYQELLQAGANVTLGTDGCGSSNNLDMLETMKTTALLQKAWREDPAALPLNELLDMATVNAAKALRLNTGKIEVGALADLVLIETRNCAFTPMLDFYANLIYSANSSCVDTVICDGNILMENRHVPGEEEVLARANELALKLNGRI